MVFRDFKHSTPIQIRFNDIDKLNHVNNALYLSYFEICRVHYLNKVLANTINWQHSGFVTARNEINYLAPVFLTDDIFCFSKMIKTGTKSVCIKNALAKKVNNNFIECANGISILVAMDYTRNESMPLPGEWRRLFNEFES